MRSETAPEVALRRALHALGLRFRTQARVIPGTRRVVDIAFGTAKVAVDVRGCYWHGCPEHGTAPKTNADWWRAKLEATRRRDDDTAARLASIGWTLVVTWEHEDPMLAANAIATVIRSRRR